MVSPIYEALQAAQVNLYLTTLDFRACGTSSLMLKKLLNLQLVKTSLMSINLQYLTIRVRIFFCVRLEYSPMYGILKYLVLGCSGLVHSLIMILLLRPSYT